MAARHVKPLAEGSNGVEYTDWSAVEGDWKYVSRFTGKTYDTSVRSCEMKFDGQPSNSILIEISNELFGKAYISQNTDFGRLGFTNPYSSEQPYPEVKGYTIDDQQVYASTITTPVNRAPINFFQFLSSGMLQLPTMYFTYDENGNMEDRFTALYDYLYDASAQSAKISATFPKLSHGGSLKVDLTKGAGVDEIYYAVILEPRDESKLLLNGTPESEVKEYGWAYSFKNIAPEIKNFAEKGTLNPNLLLGKVAEGASSFEVPLTWEGMKSIVIVAYKNGEICDMVYDFIENRTEEGWQTIGEVELDFDVNWWRDQPWPNITNLTPDNYSHAGKVPVEYRQSTRQYRYVHPYNVGSDKDYIYVNTSYGDDQAYIEASYSPYELTYSYTDRNGNTVNELQSQIMLDIATANIILFGIAPETALRYGGLTFSPECFKTTNTFSIPLSTILVGTYYSIILLTEARILRFRQLLRIMLG